MVLVDKINRSGDLVNELCRDGNAVNKAYRSGELIYQRCINENYLKEYLTFKMHSDGNIIWRAYSNQAIRTISYSKNNGEWAEITSNTGSSAPSISVVSGDIIKFKGLNTHYCENIFGESHFVSDCVFEIYGNIMSLIYDDNFYGKNVLPSGHTFCFMFDECENISSISNLELPATTLTEDCYNSMFARCKNINYVKCLATDISASGCVADWLKGVSSTGTFVKAASMNDWQTGDSGIPNGWTVINE